MKLADLFVALGFDIKGKKELDDVDITITRTTTGSLKLLAGVTALNAAFYLMMHSAAAASVALSKFVLTTGLSADELQRWQYAGRLANVEADEMAGAFKAIQNAQTALKLTGQGSEGFTFFGLDPNQSVADTLKRLHEVIQTGDVGASRFMATKLGIGENIFQFLRQANLGLEEFNHNLAMTDAQRKNLLAFNRAAQEVEYTFGQLKNQFAATFSGVGVTVLGWLKEGINLLGIVVEHLGRATPAAEHARWALAGLVGALGLFLAALIPGALEIGVFVGALLALFLLWDDFQAALQNPKNALFDWSIEIKAVNLLAAALQKVADVWGKIRELQEAAKPPAWFQKLIDVSQNETMWNILLPGSGTAARQLTAGLDDLAAVPQSRRGQAGNAQTNNLSVKIEGKVDSAQLNEAKKVMNDFVRESFFQMPAPQF